MEKEKAKKKKSKSLTQKAKKIRTVVMMSLLCVMLLSAATYAWFTLSKTAKVSNLTMTVGDVTGLQISKDGTSWSGEIQLDPISAKLMPATYVKDDEGWAFYEPEYNDVGQITGIKKLNGESGKITSDTTTFGYYYEKTFYMKSLGEAANVYLAKGTGLTGRTKGSTEAGTYVVINGEPQANDTNKLAPAAVRISFKVGSGDPVSYAPFNDVIDTGTAAAYADSNTYGIDTNESKRPVIAASQNSDGRYNNGVSAISADKSNKLFTLEKDASTSVTMCVWIEGDDAQCVNEIQLENLIGQLVFISETASESE